MTSIKAGDGCTQDLHKITHTPQVLVHVPEVGVNVISIPTNDSEKNNIKTPIALMARFKSCTTDGNLPQTASTPEIA